MASKLNIWNLAIAHLGEKAGLSSADAPYSSREAELCGQYYDMARQLMLAKIKPAYARRRIAAADVTADLGDDMPEQWQFAYARPGGAISIVGVYSPNNMNDEDDATYEFESDDTDPVIYCNIENAIIRWIDDVEDTDKFAPFEVVGLSWLLASMLAGPIIKGKDGMAVSEACEKKAWAYLNQANTEDANQRQRREIREDSRHKPAWIEARGYGGGLFPDAAVVYDED